VVFPKLGSSDDHVVLGKLCTVLGNVTAVDIAVVLLDEKDGTCSMHLGNDNFIHSFD
jgi:hypothetical protein